MKVPMRWAGSVRVVQLASIQWFGFVVIDPASYGLVLLHLENPRDVKTYRIIDLNPAAAAITGSTLENLLGRTLADFPKLLEKIFPAECSRPFYSGEARDFGRSLIR